MKLRFDSIASHVKQGMSAIYLISGDEPYQVNQSCELIRKAAVEQGYSERVVYHADKNFDWTQLRQQADSLSLFAERKLIELRLITGKPGIQGGKELQAYAANIPQDTTLLIITPKIDASAQRSKWFKSLESSGVVIQVWPLSREQLPQWIKQQLHQRELDIDADALNLLADSVEGNLLAASQEMEKLSLLYGKVKLNLAQVQSAVSDSSRFDLFIFIDEVLKGDICKISKILDGLRAEGVEPVLLLWALAREIRSLVEMSHEISLGSSVFDVMGRFRVWDKRKALVKNALNRGNAHWRPLLSRCAGLDVLIKGQRLGNIWNELLELATAMAGQPIIRNQIVTQQTALN